MTTAADVGAAAARLSKACIECHSRKVKCDAPVAGIPCGRCVGKGYPEHCKLVSRQQRKRKRRADELTQEVHCNQNDSEAQPPTLLTASHVSVNDTSLSNDSPRPSTRRIDGTHGSRELERTTSSTVSGRSPQRIQNIDELPQAQAEYNGRVHYLSILKTAMNRSERNEPVGLGSPATSSANSTSHYPQNPQIGISGLDPVDLDFLMKKGAFVLPHQDSLMVFLNAYFEFVHPYSPVLDRNHFLRSYETGSYSAFLMQTVLTSATLYVPNDVLTSCGYSNITEAQTAFFNKALLLHDFQCEKSQLCLLQGSLILGTTAFFYPIDRDVHYWFFNAVRLATKLELQKLDQLRIPNVQLRGLYKRIWWVIYCRDVLLSFLGMQSMPLVSDKTKPQSLPTEEDWEAESENMSPSFHYTVVSEQKRHFIGYCKLSVLGSRWLVRVSDSGRVDGEAMAREFHAWRGQLREATSGYNQLVDSPYLTSLLAASYRLECILYRTLKICWKTGDVTRHDWARARLRSSMFELDTLFGRALANDQLRNLPMSFNSNIPIALALHIEAALDATESNTAKSMSLIYIRQGMLILEQLQDSPVIKRVLSIFEWALDRVDLNPAAIGDGPHGNAGPAGIEPNESVDQVGAAVGHDFEEMFDQMEPWFGDFLGIDFLDNLRSSGDGGQACEDIENDA